MAQDHECPWRKLNMIERMIKRVIPKGSYLYQFFKMIKIRLLSIYWIPNLLLYSQRMKSIESYTIDPKFSIYYLKHDSRAQYQRSNHFERDYLQTPFFLFSQHCEYLLDVGTNIGEYSLRNLPECPNIKHAFLYEPNPFLAMAIRKTIEANELQNRVTFFNNGVGKKNETISLHLNLLTTGHSSAYKSAFYERQGSLAKAVPMEIVTLEQTLPLDTLSNQHILLKIDVEGMDWEVFSSAESVLTHTESWAVFLESSRAPEYIPDILANAHIFYISEDKIEPLDFETLRNKIKEFSNIGANFIFTKGDMFTSLIATYKNNQNP